MSKNKTKNSKSSDSLEDKTDIQVFCTVLYYCVLIIGLPIFSFFASKITFDKLEFSSLNANIYAAITSVIALHIALGIYLFKAYSDDEQKIRQGKQD